MYIDIYWIMGMCSTNSKQGCVQNVHVTEYHKRRWLQTMWQLAECFSAVISACLTVTWARHRSRPAELAPSSFSSRTIVFLCVFYLQHQLYPTMSFYLSGSLSLSARSHTYPSFTKAIYTFLDGAQSRPRCVCTSIHKPRPPPVTHTLTLLIFKAFLFAVW